MQQLQPNTTLQGGKYRIERVLGQGGFGITYLAAHMELQGYVAVKEFFMKDSCLRENDSTVSIPVPSKIPVVTSQQEKFRKEARRLFSLQSEHIVRVYDMFEENNTVYYVMEFIDGESLGDKMKRTGLPLAEPVVRDYLVQTLDALDEIHRQGYEHLDIKPANLMLNVRGCLKVIDFGASKQMSVDGGPTIDPTACCYTPGYAPSEQEGQFVKKFGPWTDFYALGATLYNMLTSKKPPRYLDVDEDGENAFDFTPAISSDMRQLILWMMNPRREQRPQKASDILARLHERHESETVAPQKETDDVTVLEEAAPQVPAVVERLIDNMVAVEGGTFMMGRKTKWYETGDEEEHQYRNVNVVDLGLSVLWADCNVGGSSESPIGGLYGWADPTGEKTSQNVADYVPLRKYLSNQIPTNISGTEYDMATVKWGKEWKIPSKENWKELIEKCKWTREKAFHVYGYRVEGPSGNSIFLPNTGLRLGETISDTDAGYYWTSEMAQNDRTCAYYYYFEANKHNDIVSTKNYVYSGKAVRPIREKQEKQIEHAAPTT